MDFLQSRERIAKCKATTKILILDACHSGKAARGVTGIAPNLVKGAATVVLTSCGAKQISYPQIRAIRMGAYHYVIKPPDGPSAVGRWLARAIR